MPQLKSSQRELFDSLKKATIPIVTTSNPTLTDDITKGYVVGSTIINSVNKLTFTCIDNAINSSIWVSSANTSRARRYSFGA